MPGPMARQLCRAIPLLFLTAGVLSDAVAQTPPAPVVTLAAGPKRIDLSWPVVPGASYYVVKESATTGAPFVAISPRIAQGKAGEVLEYTRPISVHRQDWSNARLRVEACNQSQIPFCSRSIEQSAAALELEAIGYLRAAKADPADGFGMAVASSADGNTLAIGAPYEDCSCTGVNPSTIDEAATNAGAVYIFVKDSSGWRQQAYIKASSVATYDLFGMTVALSGDGNTLAIGAPTVNTASTESVHVFARSAGSWRQVALLTSSDGDLSDRFGSALALSADGRTLAVGATGEDSSGAGTAASGVDNDESESGAAYVFSRAPHATSWSQTAFIKGSHSDRADFFGTSVALSSDGSTLAVGSQRDDSDAAGGHVAALSCVAPIAGAVCDVGAVDVYTRSFTGAWTHAAYLRPAVFGSEDLFGTAVALTADGRQLAVGAVGEDSTAIDSGAVYVFTRSASGWAQEAFIKASDADTDDSFGAALDFDDQGRTLAVSASLEDGGDVGVTGVVDDLLTDAGAVFLFERSSPDNGWLQTRYIKAPSPGADDHFGGDFFRGALALSGDAATLLVPAADEDGPNDATPDSGAAYLY
ncbi:MAG TPA: FG-GAP repeat protein [Steroidobacteraceae bacterium]|nr:FG-GAP repeat protein [Steroidobacteraceae bacterium]